MDKENNIVYVQTKNGIFKCYKSEQMHKPIYYPVESKTNGYIDYYDAIRILNIDDLYEYCKKQKEVIDRIQKIINTEIKLMGYAVNDSCLMLIQDILNEATNNE